MTITFKRVYTRNYASPFNAPTNNACVWDANAKETKTKATPQNSLKLLPHWHRLPKWAKILEGQYKLWSSINCVFLNKRVECNTHIQLPILGGRQTILRPKDCQKNDMPQRHNKERNKHSSNQTIPIEASNQRISIEPTRPKILWPTWIKDIMIWAKECSKETREAPHDLCTHKNIWIWKQSAQNRIIDPPKSIETYNKCKWA